LRHFGIGNKKGVAAEELQRESWKKICCCYSGAHILVVQLNRTGRVFSAVIIAHILSLSFAS
jgi:hypothetical protein